MWKSQRKLRVYATVNEKHVYRKKRCIKTKANRQAETKFTPIILYQAYMPLDLTQKQERKSNSKSLNADRKPPKDNY